MVFAHAQIFAIIAIVVKETLCDNRDRSFCAFREYAVMRDRQHDLKIWLAEKLQPHGAKTKFAEAVGLTNDKVTRSIELVDPDPKKRRAIKPHEIEAAARYFAELPPGFEGMTQWLSEGVQPAQQSRPKSNASFPPRYQQFDGDSSLPLLGQTAGGPNGRFVLNGQEVGRVFTPPMLIGVEGAYAVRVHGTSMEPRYMAGETVWLNPHEPVRQGDDVVLQIATDEENVRESYIKRFVSKSSRVTRLWQHNPEDGEANELEFDSEEVFSIHKIVFHATV